MAAFLFEVVRMVRCASSLSLIAIVFMGACGEVKDQPPAGDPDAGAGEADAKDSVDATVDATVDAMPPAPVNRCDPKKAFGEPKLVPNLNSSNADPKLARDVSPRLTPDELTIVFQSNRPGAPGGGGLYDIWMATRDKASDDFRAPKAVDGLNTPGGQYQPSISANQLEIYYMEDTSGTTKSGDVYVSTRKNATVDFEKGDKVAGLLTDNTPGGVTDDGTPFVAYDGSLYFTSNKSGTYKIYRAEKNAQGMFVTVEEVQGVSSTASDLAAVLSHDGKELYWASTRTDGGAEGGYDIWHATRDGAQGAFTNRERIDILSSAKEDLPGWLSKDGCVLYMERDGDLMFAVKLL